MTRTYTLTTSRGGGINDAIEEEQEFTVTYTISKGYPASGPSYASGGEPAEPPQVELLTVEMDGKPYDGDDVDWLVTYIEENHDYAAEAADRAEYFADQRRDARMMED
jgi:hypothetical protein